MLFKKFDPLKNKVFTILDKEGNVVDKQYEPELDKDKLLEMYKTMVLGRVADTKALQYQRQGRMLTFAPNKGQEAAQVGPMAALNKEDWLVPSFRELSAMLYKGVPLEQIYLYWYGNEMGSQFPKYTKVLPVNVPIASQYNHAAGIAIASKFQNKTDVTVAYCGDGGTSEGEFHEGLNFAAVFEAPCIFIIQNNGWAISLPRHKQTKSITLAQKAIAYGIPGIQVDGNDVLAMYVATKEAAERARNGEGPTLIEAVTYRIGAHTTSDDPTIYREDKEVEEWTLKDPILRFKKYLNHKGYWNEEMDESLYDEMTRVVTESFNKVEKSGLVKLEEIFQYQYETIPPHLQAQYEKYKQFLAEEGM